VLPPARSRLDPKSGDLVGRTTAEQTEHVFANLKAVLARLERRWRRWSDDGDLADMADFAR